MSVSNATMTSHSQPRFGADFWELLWRMSGINFVVFSVIAYLIAGSPPPMAASADSVAAFYSGEHVRVLIAAAVSGFAVLNLLWFVAALRATVADAGRDGWGTAAIAAGATVAALFLILTTIGAALSFIAGGAETQGLSVGLNLLGWALGVLSSFPRAMLVMTAAFGLWRGGMISNRLFGVGVAVIVLVLLGGTTWLSDGPWSPDGIYSRYVSPILGLAWVLVVSRVLLTRPATREIW